MCRAWEEGCRVPAWRSRACRPSPSTLSRPPAARRAQPQREQRRPPQRRSRGVRPVSGWYRRGCGAIWGGAEHLAQGPKRLRHPFLQFVLDRGASQNLPMPCHAAQPHFSVPTFRVERLSYELLYRARERAREQESERASRVVEREGDRPAARAPAPRTRVRSAPRARPPRPAPPAARQPPICRKTKNTKHKTQNKSTVPRGAPRTPQPCRPKAGPLESPEAGPTAEPRAPSARATVGSGCGGVGGREVAAPLKLARCDGAARDEQRAQSLIGVRAITRRVQLVRGEGRGVSSQYGREEGGGGGGK